MRVPSLHAEESQDYSKDKSTFTDFHVRKCAFVLVWPLLARCRSPPCLICIIHKQIRIRRLHMFTKNNGSDEHDMLQNQFTAFLTVAAYPAASERTGYRGIRNPLFGRSRLHRRDFGKRNSSSSYADDQRERALCRLSEDS